MVLNPRAKKEIQIVAVILYTEEDRQCLKLKKKKEDTCSNVFA